MNSNAYLKVKKSFMCNKPLFSNLADCLLENTKFEYLRLCFIGITINPV